jgi:regulator of replication initiation timing
VADEAAKQRIDAEVKSTPKPPRVEYCGHNSHLYCSQCKLCIDCGDCQRDGCGERVSRPWEWISVDTYRHLKQSEERQAKTIMNFIEANTKLALANDHLRGTIRALNTDKDAYMNQRDRLCRELHQLQAQVKDIGLDYIGVVAQRDKALKKLNETRWELEQLREVLGG